MIWYQCVFLIGVLGKVVCVYGLKEINFHAILSKKLLSSHKIREEDLNYDGGIQGIDWSDGSEDSQIVLCQSPFDLSLPTLNETIPIFEDSTTDTVCFLSLQSLEEELLNSSSTSNTSTYTLGTVPSLLKIDDSILEYFIDRPRYLKQFEYTPNDLKFHLNETSQQIPNRVPPLHLSIHFSSFHIKKSSIRDISERIVKSLNDFLDDLQKSNAHSALQKIYDSIVHRYSIHKKDIKDLMKKIGNQMDKLLFLPFEQIVLMETAGEDGQISACEKKIILSAINIYANHVDFEGIDRIDNNCLISMITFLASKGSVQSLSITAAPQFLNYEARGHLQSGYMGIEPYTSVGLTGRGQICGVADSGLDDLSTFFIDTSNKYNSVLTARDGTVETNRRKIIQYTAFADGYDEQGGHGTHVVGSIAGCSINGEFDEMNGMAPDAKIAFYDLGVTESSVLKVPLIYDLFDTAYAAGARVHSNSWGNIGGFYGPLSYDVDNYLYQHPDFLVVFAAGNGGTLGIHTINSPANAKNVLTIGAGQIRTVEEDRELIDEEYNIAFFSSIGPTYDSRFKPDVIAPGDFVMSAFANKPDRIKEMLAAQMQQLNISSISSFQPGLDITSAVHQISGTSMAAPLVAGTALLIRQYFQNSSFWAKYCNPMYPRCSEGAFEPTGYLVKGLFIHAGERIHRYSDPIYTRDNAILFPGFSSFQLGLPPDYFQGFGAILLKNVLPLSPRKHPVSTIANSNAGLRNDLDLIIFDKLTIAAYSSMELRLRIHPVFEKSEAVPMKVTICWYDPPHSFGVMSKLLIHDLDLFVISPHKEYYFGNKRNMTYTEGEVLTHRIRPDDRNPNEQVSIPTPICRKISSNSSDCEYRILIQANALPYFNRQQTFSLIITANGTLTTKEPIVHEHHHFIGYQPIGVPVKHNVGTESSLLQNSTLPVKKEYFDKYSNESKKVLRLETTLKGSQMTNITFPIRHCHVLTWLDIRLQFNNVYNTSDTWPYQMQLMIVDARGQGLVIGGETESGGRRSTSLVEHSTGRMRIVVGDTWNSDWMSSQNGAYEALKNVKEMNLYGKGSWEIMVMNTGSQSSVAHYEFDITMYFDEHPNEDVHMNCLPSTTLLDLSKANLHNLPSAVVPTLPADQSDSDSNETKMTMKKLFFDKVGLEVFNINDTIIQKRVKIGAFEQRGTLDHILLSIDAYQNSSYTRGTLTWLLAVIITCPQGLVSQIGGFHYFAAENHFYFRKWPDTWLLKMSNGVDWVAIRDLHAAGLQSFPNTITTNNSSQSTTNPMNRFLRSETLKWSGSSSLSMMTSNEEGIGEGEWTVELTIGFNIPTPTPQLVSGHLELFFSDANSHQRTSSHGDKQFHLHDTTPPSSVIPSPEEDANHDSTEVVHSQSDSSSSHSHSGHDLYRYADRMISSTSLLAKLFFFVLFVWLVYVGSRCTYQHYCVSYQPIPEIYFPPIATATANNPPTVPPRSTSYQSNTLQ